ncbi:hypothetical protein [Nocardioides sp. B-3]|uniref:hypothetical protein n=1 Tax=Nocardioides sp. B-3 TaxID=2895565 RepID=UPI0021529C79|nr:hypothetical protein [Nocardioides sp. B-3]UUZ59621.1 hypothetical protein LP418_00140 [Nocardioides sp. B-3]
MTLQPSRELFESCLPEALDYDLMDRVHYRRVARMLQLETAPDTLINTPNYPAARTFRSRAELAGFSVEKIPMPIDWSYAEAELRGEMKPSYTNGDAAMGVNNGGKHSVDVTYLRAAEATGRVRVRTHHDVTSIERTGERSVAGPGESHRRQRPDRRAEGPADPLARAVGRQCQHHQALGQGTRHRRHPRPARRCRPGLGHQR